MSQQSHSSTGVRTIVTAAAATTLGGKELSLPTWYNGQDTRFSAQHFTKLRECKRLAATGGGRFFNRGKGFLRFDSRPPEDNTDYRPSGRKGESLNISEPAPGGNKEQIPTIMDRFVNGDDIYARAAVDSYKFIAPAEVKIKRARHA